MTLNRGANRFTSYLPKHLPIELQPILLRPNIEILRSGIVALKLVPRQRPKAVMGLSSPNPILRNRIRTISVPGELARGKQDGHADLTLSVSAPRAPTIAVPWVPSALAETTLHPLPLSPPSGALLRSEQHEKRLLLRRAVDMTALLISRNRATFGPVPIVNTAAVDTKVSARYRTTPPTTTTDQPSNYHHGQAIELPPRTGLGLCPRRDNHSKQHRFPPRARPLNLTVRRG